MKKNRFFNGMSAKIALAAVALFGATFTSCDEDDLDINVDITENPAKVIISPQVTYLDDAGSKDVTSLATITFDNATKEGNNGVINGNPSIAAQTVTVTATYNEITGTATVNVAAIATGQATYSPMIILKAATEEPGGDEPGGDTPGGDEPGGDTPGGDTPGGDTPKVTYEVVLDATKTIANARKYAKSLTHGSTSHNASYSHNGNNWFENNNEYIYKESFKYTWTVINTIENKSADLTAYKSELEAAKVIESSYTLESSYSFAISAWALYLPYIDSTNTITPGKVINKDTKEVIATFNYVTYNSSVTAGVLEAAHPNGHGHYHAGHGHGTHGSGNSGGGLGFGE